jgi:hypothetical protein
MIIFITLFLTGKFVCKEHYLCSYIFPMAYKSPSVISIVIIGVYIFRIKVWMHPITYGLFT